LELERMTSPSERSSNADLSPPLPAGGRIDTIPDSGLVLATLPIEVEVTPEDWRAWIEATPVETATPIVSIVFHRAHVIWRPGRAVVIAPDDRIDSVKAAVIEGVRHETALAEIEAAMAAGWAELEADAEDAFEVEAMAPARRRELKRRYRRTVELRAKLVRMAPYLLSPIVHPPTIGSQVADRWRERLRMEARYEAVTAQLEVHHDVYDACGQRSSESRLARSGHAIEWAILVVLGFQSLMWLFEILSGLSAD
jgi:hypothetical protein